MKRALLTFVIVCVVGVAVFGLAVAWDHTRVASTDEVDLSRNALIHPVASVGALPGYSPSPTPTQTSETIALSNQEALAPFLMPDGISVRYYIPATGQIKEVSLADPSHKKTVASIKPRAQGIIWNSRGSACIAVFANTMMRYDLEQGTSATLPASIRNPVFAKDSSRVAYLYFDTNSGEGAISVADEHFEGYSNIMKTRLSNWNTQWINPSTLSLIGTSASGHLDTLFQLNTNSKQLDPVIENQKDLAALWSPDGSTVLFSRTLDGSTQLLWLKAGTVSAHIISLPVPASRCTWASSSIAYCSANRRIMQLHISGEVLDLTQVGSADVRTGIVTPDQRTLVYQNSQDGGIYALPLTTARN